MRKSPPKTLETRCSEILPGRAQTCCVETQNGPVSRENLRVTEIGCIAQKRPGVYID